MCGITGVFYKTPPETASFEQELHKMCAKIERRGPDAEGIWTDAERGIGLGHRRLAVIDLSEAGAQPMHSASGRFTIAFNGEIYNHLDLRAELGAISWRGGSDTETLLACFEKWGLEGTLKKAVGMFAISVWDAATQTLSLARDRMGEKPLYYGCFGSGTERTLLFGSDLTALRAHPRFNATISRDAVCTFLRFNCIGQEQTIFESVFKLPPGSIMQFRAADPVNTPQRYWSFNTAYSNGLRNRFDGSATEAVNQLELLIRQAIGRQMISDVPLGAFLSGGVDSSTIVALMQHQSMRPVKTFSIGFHDKDFDEAHYAAAVAKHLGTEHTELYVSPSEARSVIPDLPQIYTEPFADSSQIPTALVSKLARKDVTVALSGDAGDELFGGYNRYQLTARLWNKLERMPLGLRASAARMLLSVSPELLNKLLSFIPLSQVGDKLHKGAALLESTDVDALYLGMVSQWQDPASVVLGGRDLGAARIRNVATDDELSAIERMMAIDTVTYLPDDILAKVDRAAMAYSLETRVPFLDHEIVEFAWRLPIDYKIRNGTGKWPLRQILYRYVPKALIERPKMGFGVPIASWLRGPLKQWGDDLLSSATIRSGGVFDADQVWKKWTEHQSGKRNWQHQLWCILMFQSWHMANSPTRIHL